MNEIEWLHNWCACSEFGSGSHSRTLTPRKRGPARCSGCYSLSSLSVLVNIQVRVMLRTSVSLRMSGGKGG